MIVGKLLQLRSEPRKPRKHSPLNDFLCTVCMYVHKLATLLSRAPCPDLPVLNI